MAVIKTVLFSDSALFPARIFFRRIAQFFHNGIHNNDTIRYAHVSFSTRALSLCLPAAEQEECEIAYDKPLPTTTIEIVTLHFFFFLLRGYGEAEFFFLRAERNTWNTWWGWLTDIGRDRESTSWTETFNWFSHVWNPRLLRSGWPTWPWMGAYARGVGEFKIQLHPLGRE